MITLVLGGTRSGKSEVAERKAAATGHAVTYVATGTAVDAEMAARIEEHRRRRPPGWTTVESGPDLAGALTAAAGTVLVDALSAWLAQFEDMAVDTDALCAALAGRTGDTVIVSDEVGLGVHPSTEVGRRFRDALGTLNQRVADVADEVVLVVAGRVLRLERA